MTIEELRNNYHEHHTASRLGYCSRKISGYAEPYKGKFGKGYIWVSPRFDTTRFCNITYFVED